MPWSHPSVYRVRVYTTEPSQSAHNRPLQHQALHFPSLFSLAIPDVLTILQTCPYPHSFMPMHLLLPLPKTHPSPWLLGNPHLEVRTKHTEKASSLIALQTDFKVFFSGLFCAFLRILDHPAQTCDTRSLFLSIVLFSIRHALWLLFTLCLPCQNIRLVMLVCCIYCYWTVLGT